MNHGEDTTLFAGLHQPRADRLDHVGADTIVVIDTHWFTTIEHIVASHERRQGLYTSEELPRGIYAALDEFAVAVALREALGEEFCRVYAGVKTAEYDEFLQVISPWEREHLLLNV